MHWTKCKHALMSCLCRNAAMIALLSVLFVVVLQQHWLISRLFQNIPFFNLLTYGLQFARHNTQHVVAVVVAIVYCIGLLS